MFSVLLKNWKRQEKAHSISDIYICDQTTTECYPLPPVLAPCPVQNVVNILNCSTNILTISWAPRSVPVNYSAKALARSGTELLCTTQDSSCTLTKLKCGEQYTVTVKAISSTCEGRSSVANIVNSGKNMVIHKYRRCNILKFFLIYRMWSLSMIT